MGICQSPEGRLILFSNLTVEENLLMGAYTRKDKEGVKDDLEFVFSFSQDLKKESNSWAERLAAANSRC